MQFNNPDNSHKSLTLYGQEYTDTWTSPAQIHHLVRVDEVRTRCKLVKLIHNKTFQYVETENMQLS